MATLNKRIYQDIIKLNFLDTDDADVRFRVTATPFTDNDDDIGARLQEEYRITGLIFPKSSLYNERCYKINKNISYESTNSSFYDSNLSSRCVKINYFFS